jgi:DNA repair exonuclease SbcCD ATPase subunit
MMSRSHVSFRTSGLLLVCVFAAHAGGATQDAPEKKSAKAEVSADERAAAMKFAADNHPELARLLEQLDKSRPGEFARAVKEIHQQFQRLERIREKSPGRYSEQLEAWKQNSQIRVLVARWSRSRDSELEKQIRQLLLQRRETRLAQLKAEQQRLQEQLTRVDEQLKSMSTPMSVQVDLEWDQLSGKSAAGKKNNAAKPSEPPAATGVM